MLGGSISQQALKSAISKWLPGIGAAAMAIWTNYMTRQIGNKAVEIFCKGVVVEDGLSDVEVIESITDNIKIGKQQKSIDFYKLKIIINLAKIDGVVHENEISFISELIENSELTSAERIELLERIHSKEKDLEGLDSIARSPDDAIALLADMTALAKQDNELHSTEKIYVRQIGKLLNFSDKDIEEVLSA